MALGAPALDEAPEEVTEAIVTALRYLEWEARRAGLNELADSLRFTRAEAGSRAEATVPRSL